MTKAEMETIENILKRLKKPNCGCHNGFGTEELVEKANAMEIEAVGRLYLKTWIIPALELLLPGPNRNPEAARRISR